VSADPARVAFRPSVRVRVGPDRGFLFDERSGRVFSLNATAAAAVARIDEGATLAAIVDAVVAAFDVDVATVRRDLSKLVAQLCEEGLAEVPRG
jgi:hypothetical protein